MEIIRRRKSLNRYYKITKFYAFLKSAAIKGGVAIAAFVLIYVVLDYYVLDTEAIFQALVTNYSTGFILTVFLISETILGLIPPEIFIAWSGKTADPWWYLFALASLSYLGGIFAYFLGQLFRKVPTIRNGLQFKVANHISNLKKWGGVFVVIGAMLPLPHSIVSFSCGLIQYNIKHYLMWALFRYLRFVIYALVIFSVI